MEKSYFQGEEITFDKDKNDNASTSEPQFEFNEAYYSFQKKTVDFFQLEHHNYFSYPPRY